MRSHPKAIIALAAALSTAPAALATPPASWTFRIVAAEGRTGFPAIGVPTTAQITAGTPSIDEDGSTLTRWAGLFSGDTGLVVYNAATQTTAAIAPTPPDDDGFVTTSTDLDIRNHRIAWKHDDSIRVYDLAGTELYRFTPSGGPLGTYTAPSKFSLTDAGALGMRGTFAGVPTLFIDSFGPPRTQTVVAAQTAPVTNLFSTFMNQAGQFGGKVDEGTVHTMRRLQAGQPPVTILSTAVSTNYTDVSNLADINDAGQIAFYAKRTEPTDSRGFVWELRVGGAENSSTLILNDRHPDLVTSTFTNFPPDIANNGLVAFRGAFGGGQGVFMADASGMVRIAGATDSIDTNLGTLGIAAIVGGVAQNESNQVVFYADLTNGATALVVATPVPVCRADHNGQNGVDLLDIFAFLNDWFAGNTRADFNQMNGVDLLDIFAFLTAWFGGC